MKKDKSIRLAIIGLGNIGGSVLERLTGKLLPGLEVAAVCDLKEPAGKVAGIISRHSLPFVHDAEELMARQPDHVLEAASAEAAARYAPFFLERGVSFITISAGGLADRGLWEKILRLCRPEGPRLIIPSGAVGGLDILRAAAMGTVRRVHLKTTKPAAALEREDKKPAVESARGGPVTVYRGTAAEAASRYPRNINVAMALALAGVGPEETTVEIIADPACTENTHQVFIEGDFGSAEVILRNRPSPDNPRTSLLAVRSVLATLRQLRSGILVGF